MPVTIATDDLSARDAAALAYFFRACSTRQWGHLAATFADLTAGTAHWRPGVARFLRALAVVMDDLAAERAGRPTPPARAGGP